MYFIITTKGTVLSRHYFRHAASAALERARNRDPARCEGATIENRRPKAKPRAYHGAKMLTTRANAYGVRLTIILANDGKPVVMIDSGEPLRIRLNDKLVWDASATT